jgi:hypothetical protein
MKTSKYSLLTACVTTILAIVVVLPVRAATVKPSAANETPSTHWSLQVHQVDSGNVDLAYSFQIAIYENLVEEVNKTRRFQQVFRDGDHGDSAECAPHTRRKSRRRAHCTRRCALLWQQFASYAQSRTQYCQSD